MTTFIGFSAFALMPMNEQGLDENESVFLSVVGPWHITGAGTKGGRATEWNTVGEI